MLERWAIPAKTFLVGEYAALKEQSALLLTTTPCFELRPADQPGLQGIHPHSPAGRWWTQAHIQDRGYVWHDPYFGIGGLGASGAQFLTVYQACAQIKGAEIEREQLLQDYWELTAADGGLRPSGYDILAQAAQECVYINRQTQTYEYYSWPFTDLGFILIHSKHKIATHDHLKSLVLNQITNELSELVDYARQAFINHSSYHLIEAVKAYHQVLNQQGWVAEHTLHLIQRLYQETEALAIKGCGALGSDIILVLLKRSQIPDHTYRLTQSGWTILANTETLYLPF